MTDNSRPGISRRTMLGSTALIGAAGLAGCTGGDNGGEEGVLEFAHWWTAGGEEEAKDALLEGFQEEYSDVEVEDSPTPGGAGSALEADVRNRVVDGNPPSTFQIWPGEALTPYTEEDLFEPIDDVWTDDVQDAYLEGPLEAARPDGEFVVVPINIHRLNNLYYNVDVVEEAGVDPEDLESPSELLEAMEQVESETDAYGMAHQTSEAWSSLQLWVQLILGEFGADTYEEIHDGDASSVEDEIREGLELLADYAEVFNDDASSVSWDEANNHVISGDAAFIHQGTWAAGQYEGSDDFEFEDDWDYVPFPGTDGMYALNMDSFGHPVNNPSPEATNQFLEYCTTVDAQERFNPPFGSIPPRTDVPEDEFGPFSQAMIQEFEESESQPVSMAHGLAVPPAVQSDVEGVFANFNESWDVDDATDELIEALE
jgi:glucose/mannose transport system substrate-binding protein